MTVVGFPSDIIGGSGESRRLAVELPVACNRITLRGSPHLGVSKLVVGKDTVVYDGGPTRSLITGDVLLHGIRVYEGQELVLGMTATVTVVNLDWGSRRVELYMTLRKR